jgi:hypothetical protein
MCCCLNSGLRPIPRSKASTKPIAEVGKTVCGETNFDRFGWLESGTTVRAEKRQHVVFFVL